MDSLPTTLNSYSGNYPDSPPSLGLGGAVGGGASACQPPPLDLLRISVTPSENHCPQPAGMFSKVLEDGSMVQKPAACKKWSCPHCGKVKKAQLLERVDRGFAGFRVRMWTLTIRKGHWDDGRILEAWARLRANLHKLGFHVRYVWVKQFQKNGTRHLHILVSGNVNLSKSELSRYWMLATEGSSWVVDTGKPDFNIVAPAAYASQYMTRDGFHGEQFDKHERRYGTSHDFPPLYPQLIKGTKSGWKFEPFLCEDRRLEHIARHEEDVRQWWQSYGDWWGKVIERMNTLDYYWNP